MLMHVPQFMIVTQKLQVYRLTSALAIEAVKTALIFSYNAV